MYLVYERRGPLAHALADLLATWASKDYGTAPPASLVVPPDTDAPAEFAGVLVWSAPTVGLHLQPGQVAAGPVDRARIAAEPGGRV